MNQSGGNRGFTLLEITVVVSLIVILSTVFIANYRGGEKQFALKRSSHQLAQDLRGAQEMAMSSQKTGEAFPKGGYGIHLQEDSNSYILFADCDGDGKYDETGNVFITCAEATPDNPFPEAIKEIFLEEGIEVSALEPYALDPYSGDKTLEITYFPPDPIVTITPAASSASIALSFDGSTKTIYLNSGGLIDID